MTSNYLDDLVLPSIENLDIEVNLIYAGKTVPNDLLSDKSLLKYRHNFESLLREVGLQ